MAKILEGLEGVVCMMDDILVMASAEQEHNEGLMEVLGRCWGGAGEVMGSTKKADITLDRGKCKFRVKEINFLEHVVSSEGVRADPDKESVIKICQPQQSGQALGGFRIIPNYLGRFSLTLAV